MTARSRASSSIRTPNTSRTVPERMIFTGEYSLSRTSAEVITLLTHEPLYTETNGSPATAPSRLQVPDFKIPARACRISSRASPCVHERDSTVSPETFARTKAPSVSVLILGAAMIRPRSVGRLRRIRSNTRSIGGKISSTSNFRLPGNMSSVLLRSTDSLVTLSPKGLPTYVTCG